MTFSALCWGVLLPLSTRHASQFLASRREGRERELGNQTRRRFDRQPDVPFIPARFPRTFFWAARKREETSEGYFFIIFSLYQVVGEEEEARSVQRRGQFRFNPFVFLSSKVLRNDAHLSDIFPRLPCPRILSVESESALNCTFPTDGRTSPSSRRVVEDQTDQTSCKRSSSHSLLIPSRISLRFYALRSRAAGRACKKKLGSSVVLIWSKGSASHDWMFETKGLARENAPINRRVPFASQPSARLLALL